MTVNAADRHTRHMSDDKRRLRFDEAAISHAFEAGRRQGYESESEVERLRRELEEARGRLGRIAGAHTKNVGTGGMTSGLCIECGEPDPCPTRVWATTERDPLTTWDPADDEGETA